MTYQAHINALRHGRFLDAFRLINIQEETFSEGGELLPADQRLDLAAYALCQTDCALDDVKYLPYINRITRQVEHGGVQQKALIFMQALAIVLVMDKSQREAVKDIEESEILEQLNHIDSSYNRLLNQVNISAVEQLMSGYLEGTLPELANLAEQGQQTFQYKHRFR